MALITNPGHAGERRELAASLAAASTLGLDVEYLPFRGDSGLDHAIDRYAPCLPARSQLMKVAVALPGASMSSH